MAKVSKTMTFSKATIDMADMTITEYGKDSVETFDLMEIFNEWDKIENINLTFKQDIVVSPASDENIDGSGE